MRLKKNRLKPYLLKKHQTIKTNEGLKRTGYSDEGVTIYAEIWPASGNVQAEVYGQRLSYILNALVERDTMINELDGLCIDSDSVTHKVISIKTYSNHKVLELEDVRNR